MAVSDPLASSIKGLITAELKDIIVTMEVRKKTIK